MPPRKKKNAAAAPVGLEAGECIGASPPADVDALARGVRADGGAVLGTYREPLAGTWLLLCALPIDKVEPTPYQRELSETHADRLARVIPKVGRFLDPIVVTKHDAGYWTPNGMHRLVAMRRLGARAIVALLVPDAAVAFRILALNTEKAHNLKDKSLEVIRMARALAADPATAKRPESDWAFELEEPAYLTIGICYVERPRFSGASYLPILKRGDEFSTEAIARSLVERQARATKLLEVDDAVADVIARLKERGFKSPYLRAFVVARINPLRWVKAAKPGQKAPRADLDETLAKMLASARKLDVAKVREQDLTAVGGAPSDGDD